jgi:hypothetical protein
MDIWLGRESGGCPDHARVRRASPEGLREGMIGFCVDSIVAL